MMDGMRSINADFRQPPPGWSSSNGNRIIQMNSRFPSPQGTNTVRPFGAWGNNNQNQNQSKFQGRYNQNTMNRPNCYSYAQAAIDGNVPPQFHIRNSQQLGLFRNNPVATQRFPVPQQIPIINRPAGAGECSPRSRLNVNEKNQAAFGGVPNIMCWPSRPNCKSALNWSSTSQMMAQHSNQLQQSQNQMHNRSNYKGNDVNPSPIPIQTNFEFPQNQRTPYQRQEKQHLLNPVDDNNNKNICFEGPKMMNKGYCNINNDINTSFSKKSETQRPLGCRSMSTPTSKEILNVPKNGANKDDTKAKEDLFIENKRDTDNHKLLNCHNIDDEGQKRESQIYRSMVRPRPMNLDNLSQRQVAAFSNDPSENCKPITTVEVDRSYVLTQNEEEEEGGHWGDTNTSNKSNITMISESQNSSAYNDQKYPNENQDEDEPCVIDDDGGDYKEEPQQNEDNNSGEQRKFTKSYWRKQRRLRLKERLMAQKALTENNPDYIPEDRESSKHSKAMKTKEIDYDAYLPPHVLMHVKRDLVSVLMEYGQTREVKVAFEDMERSGPHHASRFHTAAIVDEEKFLPGSGSSKKNAKKAAAAHALKTMYDRGKKNLETVNERAHKRLCNMTSEEVGSHAHRVVLVSRHVLETVEETQFINYSKDKIAATFVLEYHGRMRVVGLGTGNRCILYQHMTTDGKRVIHSHAEVMARRAFLRYLHKQLLNYQPNRAHPIFVRSETGKLKIRDKIQVHLYISRPPCGDAAAFPTISNFPNKMRAIRKQGQLRTIIDDGEGAIPTDFAVPAGANGKERLRIMTCSDKICRWNVLGVQGALLSHFLDPIYINSLVIGSHTGDQRGHVPRAVSGRLKCGRLHEVIQRPYRINSPEIHYPIDELADQYNITKSKQYCITWSYGETDAEILDAITGLTNMEEMEEVVSSRVSKKNLFDLFHHVCKKFGRNELLSLDYAKAKKSAVTFNRMKSFVGQHLSAMGFGQWYSLQDTYGTDNFTCCSEECWPRLCDCRCGHSQSGYKSLWLQELIVFLVSIMFPLYIYICNIVNRFYVFNTEILTVVSTKFLFYTMSESYLKEDLRFANLNVMS